MSARDARTDVAAMKDVSRETFDKLECMGAMLTKWSSRINLVSKASLDDFWSRHILDSAQLWSYAPDDVHLWADLGTGAGFPGLVIALIAADRAPRLRVCLVESDSRKAAYLSAVARACEVDVQVVCERIETLAPLGADVISARALAPLGNLMAMAERHRRDDGICLFPKGRTVHKEIDEARLVWDFTCTEHGSGSDPTGTILEVGAMRRV